MTFQVEEVDDRLVNEFRILYRLSQLLQNLKPVFVVGMIFSSAVVVDLSLFSLSTISPS
jgi:hypothetical protein